MFSEIKKDQEQRMQKALDNFYEKLSGLRTGRASPALVENISVDAYGTPSPLKNVATISIPDPRTISINVWNKETVKNVEKAIINAEIGINPVIDGQLVRLPIPELNEERRIEMVKISSKYLEECKIAIRNIRRDAIDKTKKLEKDGEISQDDMHSYNEEIQKTTDQKITEADSHHSKKEEEIMKV